MSLFAELTSSKQSPDLVNVPSREHFFLLTGLITGSFQRKDFQIGRHEVRNTEFHEFVSIGGFEQPLRRAYTARQ